MNKIKAKKRCYGVNTQEAADRLLKTELDDLTKRAVQLCKDMERVQNRIDFVSDNGEETWMNIYDALRLFHTYEVPEVKKKKTAATPRPADRSFGDFRNADFGDDLSKIDDMETASQRIEDGWYMDEFAGKKVHIFYKVDPDYGFYQGDYVTSNAYRDFGDKDIETYHTFKYELEQMYGVPTSVAEPQVIDGKYLHCCNDDAERLEMGYVQFVSQWELPDQDKVVTLIASTEWHETTVRISVMDTRYEH